MFGNKLISLDPVIILPNDQKETFVAVWGAFISCLSRIVNIISNCLPLQIGIFAIIALGAVDIVLAFQNRGGGD